MKHKITVVIVTYNGSKWIEKNFISLLNSTLPVSIVIVDNASTDSTLAIVAKFPEITCIKSEENLGFGRANNLGIRFAIEKGAEAIFLLNQDTWVFENTIQNLVEMAKKYPEFGILSPMHLTSNETDLDANFENYYKRQVQQISENLVQVPFVNAAAWLISSSCFKRVGLFEPEFRHYGEDRNFCDRMRYHGYKVGVCTTSKIVHDRSIVRNFNKDIVQSQFKIFCALLNINNSHLTSLFLGLKEVFGLPKYFFQHYGFRKSVVIFYKLALYYSVKLVQFNSIVQIREAAKSGKTGY